MKRKYLGLLLLSLLLNFATISYFVGKRIYYSNWSYFNPPKSGAEKLALLLKSRADSSEIIFVGTSLTYGFPLAKAFGNPHIKNLGVLGNTSRGVFLDVSKVINRHPKKLFIEAGINDLRKNYSEADVYSYLAKTIDIARLNSPRTVIYVYSIFPTSYDIDNVKSKLFNKKLKDLCEKKAVAYIDLYDEFLRGPRLDTALTLDGIHFNNAGYFLWRRSIEQYVIK